MNILMYTLLPMLAFAAPALAQVTLPEDSDPALTAQADTAPAQPQPTPMELDVASLQSEWAVIKYQTPSEEAQEQAINDLAKKAEAIAGKYPGAAEPLIWQGIILATKAGMDGPLSALSDAKDARDVLLQAEKLNPDALNGSVYTSLGSLYYKVPGFPIGFGDDDKAKTYLQKALALNPNGIDPNYFYGDFLAEQGEYAHAEAVLNHALQAAPRPGRELADKGRAEEIRNLLSDIQKKKGS